MQGAWEGRSVLVTGGNGFLGSHVVARLLDEGARVTCLIKEELPLSLFCRDNLASRVRCVSGIVEDSLLVREVLRESVADALFHLAAQPIVGEARTAPLQTMESNVRGTYAVLEAARKWGGLRAVVVASSDKVYGEAERLPYVEVARLGGIDVYDASKVCTDVLAQAYARTFGLPVGVARSGNFYGPGDAQWSRIVPGTIRALAAGRRPVVRSDGTPTRDYFYVGDAAEAFLALGLALDRPDVHGECFNFGTGVETSVMDVVRTLVGVSGVRVEPLVLASAQGEIQSQRLDCKKALKRLGWSHQTTLTEGLGLTWPWYEVLFRERGDLLV